MKIRTFHAYISVILYVLFIFLTQWSLAAAESHFQILANTFSDLVNYVVLPSIISLAFYGLIVNFRYYMKHKRFTLAFTLILFFIALSSRSISLTLPLLIGFASLGASVKRLARYALTSLGALLLISCILFFLGLNGGNTVSKPLFGVDEYYMTTVVALGLSNPNSVMLIFFNIIALSLFLCNRRYVVFVSIILFALVVYLSAVTGSTTGLVIGIVTLLLMLCVKYRKKTSNVIRKITPWMFILVTIITFIISINFGSSDDRQNNVNSALTGRPYLWNLRIEDNSYLNIYGQNDQYSRDAGYALDNAPLYVIVYIGLGAYLVFAYIFYRGSKSTQSPELVVYIFAATLLMFMEKMELYSLVLIFLQQATTEHWLLATKGTKR